MKLRPVKPNREAAIGRRLDGSDGIRVPCDESFVSGGGNLDVHHDLIPEFAHLGLGRFASLWTTLAFGKRPRQRIGPLECPTPENAEPIAGLFLNLPHKLVDL
jgi:hypothetical protein